MKIVNPIITAAIDGNEYILKNHPNKGYRITIIHDSVNVTGPDSKVLLEISNVANRAYVNATIPKINLSINEN
jgi:hypothetical protein